MNNNLVSIIIPNWNGKILLTDCLKSVFSQSINKPYEVIVVDNGSTDGSVKYIQDNFPKTTVVELEKNYGFAKAINAGVKLSTAKYIALLNNDTAADKNWLKNLVLTAQKNPKIFSVGSKLLNYFNREKIDGVGIMINEVGQAKSIGWEEEDRGQFGAESYIFGATGGASLFNRKLFVKLGMFDEKYFMYSEEVDLAFRSQFIGLRSIYCPKAVVYHKHKMSSQKLPQHLEYWQFRNMTMTIIKDFPFEILAKDYRWLKIFLVHLNTILYQLKGGFFWPPFAADLWILIHLPGLLKQRWEIQKARKVSNEYIESFMSKKQISFCGLLR